MQLQYVLCTMHYDIILFKLFALYVCYNIYPCIKLRRVMYYNVFVLVALNSLS